MSIYDRSLREFSALATIRISLVHLRFFFFFSFCLAVNFYKTNNRPERKIWGNLRVIPYYKFTPP